MNLDPSFAEKVDEFLVRYLCYSNYKNYVDRLNLKGNERVLEIGCGTGNLTRFLSSSLPDGEIVSFDISPYQMSVFNKEDFQNVIGITGSLDELSLDNDSFDAAVVHYILHDIPRARREKTLDLIWQKLRSRGRLFVREPTRKRHGMLPEEIENLMSSCSFEKLNSMNIYSVLMRSQYEGIFEKDI